MGPKIALSGGPTTPTVLRRILNKQSLIYFTIEFYDGNKIKRIPNQQAKLVNTTIIEYNTHTHTNIENSVRSIGQKK